ncbi:hypothetical protein DMN91_001820 [Ooceraea biroi]|uniref:Putative RISC-loading complex subunit n=1 Tax=Ooceraea biroi TaxID=2015173 RepID=A0A026X032_OOCBI|nr:interferon-inducible double-stranded RNA-dependent protein kinase activator A homolog [Ooceraea biroi]EZA60759.1 putative RISC-loading complex subunit [Ooceraea biroi]RLU25663.1 hypothetical protein DMN91_001820 [Ooceraea biroi]
MNKTPVSILQEMMVKQGMIPDYELIHDGGGRHLNTFTYQVTCDGLIASGTGRCKKDAKHEAAKAMLTEIAVHRNYPQLPAASAPESPSKSPFHTTPLPPKMRAVNAPFFNAIGELQDLCADNNLEEPIYIPISDVGPPHARIFTIRCKVSSFTEDGVSTTKKQAKHEAARKMIDKIQELVDGLNDTSANENELLSVETDHTEANENAKRYYQSIKPKKINLGIKLSEYHVKWKDSLEIDKRNEILKELDCIIENSNKSERHVTNELITEILFMLETLLTDLNITINMRNLNANNHYFMKAIQLDTCPVITHIGAGATEQLASWQAILLMINSIKLLLS